ncbi:MAG: hypothetical protein KGJ60_06760 [Verrucomicrobiota bacterium]|nr:hypothetical protein [Verrucomicrobiota bacterium]
MGLASFNRHEREARDAARDAIKTTRRDFLKTGLLLGAGLPIAAGLERAWTIAMPATTDKSAAPRAAVPAPDVVFSFDARSLEALDLRRPAEARKVWDTLHLLAALQGLANRSAPRLYLFYCSEFGVETNRFWFDWFRRRDGWLRHTRVRPLNGVTEVVSTFRDAFDGLTVYDPNVPATSNLASTAAGVERLLPVRFDTAPNSLFTLLARRLRLPLKLWLVNPDDETATRRSPT